MALIHLELLASFMGVVAGTIGFVAFTFCLEFYTAGLLALYSGILAGIAFHVHRLYFKNVLKDWYTIEIMHGLKFFGFIGIVIGTSYLGWSVFRLLYWKNPLIPILHSSLVPVLWAFLTFLNGSFLFLTARKYCNMSEENQSLLSHAPTGRRYS